MSEQLLPCPFCGSKAQLLRFNTPAYEGQGFFPDKPHHYAVKCSNKRCGVRVDCGLLSEYQNDPSPKIAAWNRRALLSATRAAPAAEASEGFEAIDDGGPYNGIDWQATCETLQTKVTQLQAALAEARRDAERIRPVWAQGWTTDSEAAQASAAALSQLWRMLGVENQTDAVITLRAALARVQEPPENE